MTKEEAIEMLRSKMDGKTDTSYEWCECVRMAIKALSDLVAVVRCQDCVHHYKGNCYRIEKVTLSVNADDFCSRGERRET